MRKQIIENAAYEVATQVRAVEDSIDAALADAAELQSELVRARAAMGVSVVTGQAAFEQLSLAIQGLIAARGSIGGCHVALVDAKQSIPGLRTVSWGDGEECPPPGGQVDLRIVA